MQTKSPANQAMERPIARKDCDPLTRSDIWSALQHIPSDDRETWVRMAMAVKSELGPDGFAIWNEWSRSAENYQEKAARDVWRSIKDGRVTIGSLIHLAKMHGWRRESHSKPVSPVPNPSPAPTEPKRDTSAYAAELWLAAEFSDNAVAGHPYAQRKGIRWAAGAARGIASGRVIGQRQDCIIVPARDLSAGRVVAVQAINAKGQKQTFGSVKGHGLLLGNTLDKRIPWYVCEGWASAVSIVFHHQKGHGVCAASFGKLNQDTVAHKLAEVHQPDEIVILEEVDR